MPLSRLLLTLAAGLCLVPAMAEDVAPVPATAPVDAEAQLRQQASYIIGADIAQKVGGIIQQMDLDHEQVLAGLGDVLSGKGPAIPPEAMGPIMQRFQERAKQAEADKAAKEAAEAPKRKDANVAWLAEHGKQPGVITTASGLQYEVLASGSGASPKMGDEVSVHYTGTLLNGTVFDSSKRNGSPISFTVGQVIAGWNEALVLMKEGDTWKLSIPSDLAYGENGPPGIGKDQVLIFEVELLKVTAK